MSDQPEPGRGTWRSIFLSFDGGRTWKKDPGNYAEHFVLTNSGVYAGLDAGGLYRWVDGVGVSSSANRDVSTFSWKAGRLEWTGSGVHSIEILDVGGRRLERIDVAPGTFSVALEPHTSLRIARLEGSHGSRSIVVPALR